jgi:cysteine-rich repeat protein
LLPGGTSTNRVVDMSTFSDNLPDSACAWGGGGDALFSFSVDIDGVLEVDYAQFVGFGEFAMTLYASDGTCTDAGCRGIWNPTGSELWPITAGDYVLMVEETFPGSTTLLDLTLTTREVVCGDGFVDPGEQCDDGNLQGRDGCEADCTITPVCMMPPDLPLGLLSPAAPIQRIIDLSVASANLPDSPCSFGSGNDLLLSFSTSTDGVLSIDYNQLMGFGEFVLTVYANDGNCTEQGACQAIFSTTGVVDWALDAGDYVLLAEQRSVGSAAQVELTLGLRAVVCGDGVVDGSEECDDGNLQGRDGCEPDCTLTPVCMMPADYPLGLMAPATPVQQSVDLSLANANLPDSWCSWGGGNDLLFSLSVPANGVLEVDYNQPPGFGDFALTLYPNDGTCSTQPCMDVWMATGSLEWPVTPGDYVLLMEQVFLGSASAVDLTIEYREVICGDGQVDGPEECDDGNLVGGDGCEADCTWTPSCALAPDVDLGLLVSGVATPASVDLRTTGDTLPDLFCSASGLPGAGDAMVAVEVANAGVLSVSFDHTGGDHQYALYADDGSCTLLDCHDPFPAVLGSRVAAVVPGRYLLVVEAWEPGVEAVANLIFTAP